jgi:hypothetical protein
LLYDAIKTYVKKYISHYYCKYWIITFVELYALFKENIFSEIDLKYMLLLFSILKGAIIHIGFNLHIDSNYKAYTYKWIFLIKRNKACTMKYNIGPVHRQRTENLF